MPAPAISALKPRKSARQARAVVTVDAICEAAIQVLLAEGVVRFTTTRVAARAGVSVGTLYQYFPQKQALLYAVLQRHLEAMAVAMEAACRRCEGQPLAVISDTLVGAYIDAKTADLVTACALFAVSVELQTDALLGEISRRIGAAMTRTLGTASDLRLQDVAASGAIFRAGLAGTVRAVLERGTDAAALAALRRELPVMLRAYLVAASRPRRAA